MRGDRRRVIRWLRRLGYVAAVVACLVAAYALVLRPWHQRWGASDEEVLAPMAGDGLVPSPNWSVTRAVSIEAPPSAVWPWLVQMGYQRGGLYSYDWLERLMGLLDRPSADSILPEFQSLSVGDTIPIGNDPGWPVAAIEKERVLVLDIKRPRLHVTWSLQLAPRENGATRLVLRYRGFVQPRVTELPLYLFLDAGEFFMSRRMLLGIKERAEHLATGG